MPPRHRVLFLLAAVVPLLASLGCSAFNVVTSTCTTCFAEAGSRCERWSGNEGTNRRITVRELCQGEVPPKHARACEQVLEALEQSTYRDEVALPAGHFEVTCTSKSKFRPFYGCGGFN